MDTAIRDTPLTRSRRLTNLIRVDTRSDGDAFNRAIVDQLRAAATRQGKTYRDLEETTGISRPTIARLLAVNEVARQSELRMGYVYALCRALDLDLVGVVARAEQSIGDQGSGRAPRAPRRA